MYKLVLVLGYFRRLGGGGRGRDRGLYGCVCGEGGGGMGVVMKGQE